MCEYFSDFCETTYDTAKWFTSLDKIQNFVNFFKIKLLAWEIVMVKLVWAEIHRLKVLKHQIWCLENEENLSVT